MNELLVAISGLVTLFGGAFAGWIFARRKSKAEAVSVEIDNNIKTAGYYQNILDDFDKRLAKALEDLGKATEIIRERDSQIADLTKTLREQNVKMEDFMKHIDEMTDELRKYKQLNGKKS